MQITRKTKMKKLKIIITVLLLGILTASLLGACNSTGNKAEAFKKYSDAITAGLNTESFYIKYSASSDPNVTQKLNYAIADGLIGAVYDRETRGSVSTSHEYIYFGHALPEGVKAADADDYRLTLFKYSETPVSASTEDFFAIPEINALLPETVLNGLNLSAEEMTEVDGVDFCVTAGEVDTFSFRVSDTSNQYYGCCTGGNYLIVRAIQGRVNKISDSKGTFSIYFDYVGPNIALPAY